MGYVWAGFKAWVGPCFKVLRGSGLRVLREVGSGLARPDLIHHNFLPRPHICLESLKRPHMIMSNEI